jgi:ketosteroid isomerase-like protein
MEKSKMKAMLDRYYEGIVGGQEWGSLLSDDFLLSGTVAKDSKGRDAYVNNNFFKMVQGLQVKSMVIEGDSACAVVDYALQSPKGKAFACEVAEIWKAKSGKLVSVAIYFDTAAFQKSME